MLASLAADAFHAKTQRKKERKDEAEKNADDAGAYD